MFDTFVFRHFISALVMAYSAGVLCGLVFDLGKGASMTLGFAAICAAASLFFLGMGLVLLARNMVRAIK